MYFGGCLIITKETPSKIIISLEFSCRMMLILMIIKIYEVGVGVGLEGGVGGGVGGDE